MASSASWMKGTSPSTEAVLAFQNLNIQDEVSKLTQQLDDVIHKDAELSSWTLLAHPSTHRGEHNPIFQQLCAVLEAQGFSAKHDDSSSLADRDWHIIVTFTPTQGASGPLCDYITSERAKNYKIFLALVQNLLQQAFSSQFSSQVQVCLETLSAWRYSCTRKNVLKDVKEQLQLEGKQVQEVDPEQRFGMQPWMLIIHRCSEKKIPSVEKPQALEVPGAVALPLPRPIPKPLPKELSPLQCVLHNIRSNSYQASLSVPLSQPLLQEDINFIQEIEGYQVVEQPNEKNSMNLILEKSALDTSQLPAFSRTLIYLVKNKVKQELQATQWSVPVASILELRKEDEGFNTTDKGQETFEKLLPYYLLLELPSEQNNWSMVFMRKEPSPL